MSIQSERDHYKAFCTELMRVIAKYTSAAEPLPEVSANSSSDNSAQLTLTNMTGEGEISLGEGLMLEIVQIQDGILTLKTPLVINEPEQHGILQPDANHKHGRLVHLPDGIIAGQTKHRIELPKNRRQ